MYIAQQYRADNGMDLEEEINSIKGDQLKSLRKRAKKAEKALKLSWELYTVQRDGPKRRKVPKEQSIGKSNRWYADICVMVKDPSTDKGKNAKSIIRLRLYKIYHI